MINTDSVLHGFTDLKNLDDLGPIVLNQAKGVYVYDQNGKKYLDANSGLWNSVVGFDHPRMIEVAKKQYEKFSGYHSFFGRISEPAVKLADKLIEISPFSRGKVFFTNSGSEANDTTVKLLWFINRRKGKPQRRKIITRINSYHGVTAVSASMTGKPYNSEFGLPLEGFIHSACPHYWKFGHEGESEEDFTVRMGEDLENIIWIVVPAAMPEIITGIRLSVVRAVKGVIVGQIVIALIGFGGLFNTYLSYFLMERFWALIIVVFVMSFSIIGLVELLERRIAFYAKSR